MRVDERLVNGWQGSVCSNEADVRACAVLQGLGTGCSDHAQVEMQECGGWWLGHGLGKKKKKKDKTCITDGLIQQKWGGMRGQTELRSSCVLL